ncbi:hemerythrin domain-containing protein [Halomonas ramblicola]|uniref:hemerythrin domain-containing protein n=1 Tax=Halomonas ramblicola TaxID=747349 RepID=UPI0025B52D83|nr:hemerythrin domain-containing protein [Halomonas ramblicola]MDN3522978.1 hemerythrin domain-containing protein [Halomonas ramblicola]
MRAIVLERLHADHHRYQALICILDRQLHIAACDEIPDYRLLARLFHYLTHQPEEWHHRVEDRLFARLAARLPESRELLEVLTEEHRRIARYGRELEERMQHADATPEEGLDLNVLNLARAFSELYHHHLHTEDHRALPLLEAHFPAAELDDLDLGVSLASPAEGSPSFQELYRRIAENRTGLRLGHDEQADFCPLCDARPAHSS